MKLTVDEQRMEQGRILTFKMSELRAEPDAMISLKALFDHYVSWLEQRKLTPTKLSIDGFGRYFPRNEFKRHRKDVRYLKGFTIG